MDPVTIIEALKALKQAYDLYKGIKNFFEPSTNDLLKTVISKIQDVESQQVLSDLALIGGQAQGALNLLIEADGKDGATRDTELALAESQSVQALQTAFQYSTVDPAKDLAVTGMLVQVMAVRIAVIIQVDDGAFLNNAQDGSKYWKEVTDAVAKIDGHMANLVDYIQAHETIKSSTGYLILTRATGESINLGFGLNLTAQQIAAAKANAFEADKQDLGYYDLVEIRGQWKQLINGGSWEGSDSTDDTWVGQDPGYPQNLSAPYNYYAQGKGGNDRLQGGFGNDVLIGGGDDDTIHNTPLPDNDTLLGGEGNDVLRGGWGDDWLYGGHGNDRLYGGGGNDWASYDDVYAPVTVSLGTVGLQQVRPAQGDYLAEFDSLDGIENLEGTAYADTLTGDRLDNILSGREGNDTLQGSDGDDTLRGGLGDDRLDGGSNNGKTDDPTHDYPTFGDVVSYEDATSAVTVSLVTGTSSGGGGADVLVNIESLLGSAWGDTLTGNDGDNWINGAIGDDSLAGGKGSDTLIGGFGDDTLDGGDGNDTLIADQSKASGEDGRDVLNGGSGDDLFLQVSTWLPDEVFNRSSVDTFSGGAGRDTYVLAGPGDGARLPRPDVIVDFDAGLGGDVVDLSGFGSLADQGFAAGYFKLVQFNGVARLQIRTTDSSGNIRYVAILDFQNHSIADFDASNFSPGVGFVKLKGPTVIPLVKDGGTGPDSLTGGEGNDWLTGHEGNDTLQGFGGNDILYGNGGEDSLAGGNGNDVLAGDYGDGVGGADTLEGGAGNDTLDGGAGDDLLSGGADDDDYKLVEPGDTIVEGNNQGIDTVESNGTYTLGANLENLILNSVFGSVPDGDGFYPYASADGTGNGLDNVLTGSYGDNLLSGLGGNDTLDGLYGNDTLQGGGGNDVLRLWVASGLPTILDGGDGLDTVDFASPYGSESGLGGPYQVQLSLAESGFQASYGLNVQLVGIENIRGTLGGPDTLTGDAKANTLWGMGGNDTLDGGGGNDTLDGGGDNDTLIGGAGRNTLLGGAGSDTASYAGMTAAVYADIRSQTGVVAGFATDIMTSIENLSGGSGDDTLIGDDADNVLSGQDGKDALYGLSGNDTFFGGTAAGGVNHLYGGADFDTVSYAGSATAVQVDLGAQSGWVGGVLVDALNSIEGAAGGDGNDSLIGSDIANSLVGGYGNDILRGLGGNDTLEGGATTLGGFNQLFGGEGSDTAVYRYDDGVNGSMRVDLRVQRSWMNGTLLDTMDSIENVNTDAGYAVLIGNDDDNILQTSGGDNDLLYGMGGNDTLIGGGSWYGTNHLLGGEGSDTVSYLGTSASVKVDLRGQAGWIAGVLTDTMNSIENATGGSGDDTLIGTAAINVLDGADGNDTLIGGAATDGVNTLIGGSGSDTASYQGTTQAVRVDLRLQTGLVGGVLVDQMSAIENVTGGSGSDTLIGTDDATVLKGAVGNDMLFGIGGNDILQGGAGNDWLYGGADNDTADYSDQTLGVTINLAAGTASGTGAGKDTLSSIENATGGAGNDLIYGSAVANVIEGGAGHDALHAGTGPDTFVYTGFGDSDSVGGYDLIYGFKAGKDKIDLSALQTDATHIAIASNATTTALYIEQTPGTFNKATDMAIVFNTPHAVTLSSILF